MSNGSANNKGRVRRNPWYSDLLSSSTLSGHERSIFAVRGVLPKFRGILLTLRIIHLYDLQVKDGGRDEGQAENPSPWHFPGVEDSTHHLFLHTRLISKSPSGWTDMIALDTTLSMQFVVPGDFDWLKVGPILPGYIPIDQSLLPISQEEKGANLLAGQIGHYLADRWMPTIEEQWMVERHIDPASRKSGAHLRLLPEEKKAERYRIAEWGGRMDYCCTRLIERYENILQRTPPNT